MSAATFAPATNHVKTLAQACGRMIRLVPTPQLVGAAIAAVVLTLALGRVHLRVQTTLVGYEIGRLKNDESKLLEERSFLRMQLAKLTTKKHLIMMTESGALTSDTARPSERTYAQQ